MAQKLYSSYLIPHLIPAAIIIIINLFLINLNLPKYLGLLIQHKLARSHELRSAASHKLWDCIVGTWINKGWIHLDLHFCKAEPSCPNDGAGFLWGFFHVLAMFLVQRC